MLSLLDDPDANRTIDTTTRASGWPRCALFQFVFEARAYCDQLQRFLATHSKLHQNREAHFLAPAETDAIFAAPDNGRGWADAISPQIAFRLSERIGFNRDDVTLGNATNIYTQAKDAKSGTPHSLRTSVRLSTSLVKEAARGGT